MKVRHVMMFAILVFIAFSCIRYESITRLDVDKTYPISVEGEYFSAPRYEGKVPAIVLEKGKKTILYTGKLIAVSDSGVMFAKDGQIPVFEKRTRFYSKEDLIAVVDSTRKVIFGRLPNEYISLRSMKLHLLRIKEPDEKRGTGEWNRSIVLKPNQPFAFYVKPGRYEIRRIEFVSDKKIIEEAVNFNFLSFTIRRNVANYLGQWRLNPDDKVLDARRLTIPYLSGGNEIDKLVAESIAMPIGGAIYNTYQDSKGILDNHILEIGYVDNYQSTFDLSTYYSMVEIDSSRADSTVKVDKL